MYTPPEQMERQDNRNDHVSEAPKSDLLGILADVNRRLAAVEENNRAMRDEFQIMRERSGTGLDPAHVAAFADKWFHHDRPVNVDDVPVAAFDPFTGERLVATAH